MTAVASKMVVEPNDRSFDTRETENILKISPIVTSAVVGSLNVLHNTPVSGVERITCGSAKMITNVDTRLHMATLSAFPPSVLLPTCWWQYRQRTLGTPQSALQPPESYV